MPATLAPSPKAPSVMTLLQAQLAQSLDTWRVAGLETPNLWPGGEQSPEADALREACRFDLARFMRHFFPGRCADPFNAMHLDICAMRRQRLETGVRGWRDVTIATRGSAKTTVKLIEDIHDALYRTEQYILICGANADEAREKVKDILYEFETNAELLRIFGPQKTRNWKQADFTTATGCSIRAISPKGKVRGALRHGVRPTKIRLDDAEDPETVLTPLQRQRFHDFFTKDVVPLGVEGHTNYDVIGTILHPESELAQLRSNPGYTVRTYQAVQSFADTPEAWDLWRQWRELVLDLDNPERLTDARTFYEAHESAMLHGVAVLWPERQGMRYMDLMLLRIVDGESAFWQERQNDPQQDESYLFDLDAIATCRLEPEGLRRQDGRYVLYATMSSFIAFYDPTPGTQSDQADWAACPVVCQDSSGYQYVVDAYLNQLDSQDAQLDGVVDVCCRWQVSKLGIESNGFQANLVDALRQKFVARASAEGTHYEPMLVPVKHSGAKNNKTLRIRTLQSPLTNHWLWFAASLPGEWWRQFGAFTTLTTDNVDDSCDSLAGARAMLLTGEI